ncbi:hypothetical protein BKA93DRAFT_750466 [Sparassis latifolia]
MVCGSLIGGRANALAGSVATNGSGGGGGGVLPAEYGVGDQWTTASSIFPRISTARDWSGRRTYTRWPIVYYCLFYYSLLLSPVGLAADRLLEHLMWIFGFHLLDGTCIGTEGMGIPDNGNEHPKSPLASTVFKLLEMQALRWYCPFPSRSVAANAAAAAGG